MKLHRRLAGVTIFCVIASPCLAQRSMATATATATATASATAPSAIEVKDVDFTAAGGTTVRVCSACEAGSGMVSGRTSHVTLNRRVAEVPAGEGTMRLYQWMKASFDRVARPASATAVPESVEALCAASLTPVGKVSMQDLSFRIADQSFTAIGVSDVTCTSDAVTLRYHAINTKGTGATNNK